MAIVARALSAALDRPDPVTISAHYFYPGKPGDGTIETRILKQGRSFSSGTAVLLSEGQALLSCIGTFGDLANVSGPEIIDQGPPVMPDPDDCLPVVATDTFPPPFMGKIELRLHPEDGQFLLGKRTGTSVDARLVPASQLRTGRHHRSFVCSRRLSANSLQRRFSCGVDTHN